MSTGKWLGCILAGMMVVSLAMAGEPKAEAAVAARAERPVVEDKSSMSVKMDGDNVVFTITVDMSKEKGDIIARMKDKTIGEEVAKKVFTTRTYGKAQMIISSQVRAMQITEAQIEERAKHDKERAEKDLEDMKKAKSAILDPGK